MADIVNFYDELGLDRNASVGEIQDGLDTLKLQLASKVARPSSQQEKWKHQLQLVNEAEIVFKNEDSRDKYDIDLHRAGTSPEQPQQVDWTTRAWNYYFIGDNGAAFVAARKAKEQNPSAPMPYVVSAWVQLRDEEWKLAKQDADEAFVLDELTADSVDVQMVRGTAYYFMKDCDRALKSFERALAKAANGEKPEIYWRKSLTHAALGDWQASFDSGILGLTGEVEMTDFVRDHLDQVTSDAMNRLDNVNDPTQAARKYDEHRKQISSMSMGQSSKTRLMENAGKNAERCRRLSSLRKERSSLAAVDAPRGERPEISLLAFGAAFFGFLFMLGAFQASGGAGFVFLLIEAAIIGYIVFTFNKGRQYDGESARHAEAQKRLEVVLEHLNAQPSLTAPITLSLAK